MLWYNFAFLTPFSCLALVLLICSSSLVVILVICVRLMSFMGHLVLFLLLLVRLLRGSTKHAWYAVFFFSLSYICVIHVSARQPGGSFEGNEAWGAWAPQTPLHTSCELLKCLANGTEWESCYIRQDASCKTRWRMEMVLASLPVCRSEWDARVNVVFTPGGEVAWLSAQILNWSLKSRLKR